MLNVQAFDVLGEPIRRRLLQCLASAGEQSAGALVATVQHDFAVSQPAVSQHLKALRDAGLVAVRPDGTRRLYSLRPEPLAQAERWLAEVRNFWAQRLDSLDTELVRGRRTPQPAARAAFAPRRMA